MSTQYSTLISSCITAFRSVIENYSNPDPTTSEEIIRLVEELKILDEEVYEIVDDLDYALWAGPSYDSFNESTQNNLLKFAGAIEDGDYRKAKNHMESLPVPILVSVRDFYTRFTKYFN